MATKNLLVTKLSEPVKSSRDKVTVVGCGMVGCASAMAIVASVSLNQENKYLRLTEILFKETSGEVVICDMDAKRLEGEMKDFQHGSLFLGNCKVTASTGNDFLGNIFSLILT